LIKGRRRSDIRVACDQPSELLITSFARWAGLHRKELIKMRFVLFILLLAAVALSGCKGDAANVNGNVNSNGNSNANALQSIKVPQAIKPNDAPNPDFKPCNLYFPLVPGSTAKYVVNYASGITGDLTVVVDAAEENGRQVFIQRSQLVDRSGGMQIVQTITRKFVCEGDRVMILSEKTDSNISGQQSSSDFEYRASSMVMTDSKSMLIKGSTWTHGFIPVYQTPGDAPARSDQPTIVAFEVLGPEHVTTSIGTFKAIPVTRRIGENLTVDHYVPGLGLVKRQSKEGSSWELKEYSGLKPQD
jgi:hypothetical protein